MVRRPRTVALNCAEGPLNPLVGIVDLAVAVVLIVTDF
jgi:hypothetical protein